MLLNHYRVNDIAKKVDRDKSTIIRWEHEKLIPQAKRDSRGWRYYSKKDVDSIVKLIRETNYFQQQEAAHSPTSKKASYVTVGGIILFMVYSLIGLSQSSVLAFTNQTNTLYATVSAGILDIVSASSSQSFSSVTVLFTAQTSTASRLGAFRVSDARGSGAGWTVNLAGNDWKSGEDVMQLDYDSTGTDDNLGKLCVVADSASVSSIAGQDTTNVTPGATDCFSAGVTQIDLVTASASFGKGDYWIVDFSLGQHIPSNPTAQEYTTTIVMTIA